MYGIVSLGGSHASLWGEQDERGEQGEDAKNAMFTTYPHETKRLVNKVNVAPRFFALRRTLRAKPMQVLMALSCQH